MTDKKKYIYEEDAFILAGLKQDGCCFSCHEDVQDYGFDYSEIPIPDGSIARVCCDAARQLSLKLYGSEDAYISVDT